MPRKKRLQIIQPSPVGGVFPNGAYVSYDDEGAYMTLDFVYGPSESGKRFIVARVHVDRYLAIHIRDWIDDLLKKPIVDGAAKDRRSKK